MTGDIVIRAEGLGKKYVIGHEAEREPYVTLRDVLARGARSALRKAADMAKGRIVVEGDTVEEFWALKDINFEVKRGEVLGIIGRNGAGKSTLLKILSRITEPTEGRVTINGRVASLLEVGTGFHPELTGRENVYLNGAILGMTRAEIKRKFDEIVAFAGVEKFLDTPVKRYSSGMYVRLAFAVAAHLEPEILVVDEVLSVGDAEFQKKCMGKMQDVAGHGRTVLFVSHNMAAVKALCVRAILMEGGFVDAAGDPMDMIERYLIASSHKERKVIRSGTGVVQFTSLEVYSRGRPVTCVNWGDEVIFKIGFVAKRPVPTHSLRASLTFAALDGTELLSLDSFTSGLPRGELTSEGTMWCKVRRFPMITGTYDIHLYISIDDEDSDFVPEFGRIEVLGPKFPNVGWAAVDHSWEISARVSDQVRGECR